MVRVRARVGVRVRVRACGLVRLTLTLTRHPVEDDLAVVPVAARGHDHPWVRVRNHVAC